MKNRHLKSIDEEQVCMDSLVHCLKYRCGCRKIVVKKEKNDPPDFWITINGKKFAVEVTSIVEEQEQEYRARLRNLKQIILNSSLEQDSLNGKYVLLITRHPKLPKKTSHKWCDLAAQATSFISMTRNAESTNEISLLKDANGSLRIKKISGQGAAVGIMGPVNAKNTGYIQEELQKLIKERVNEKRQKLENKKISVLCPRVMLLLYDAYGYGGVEDAQKVLLNMHGYDWFHSIFWAASFTDRPNVLFPANPSREGRFLYSANKEWQTGS